MPRQPLRPEAGDSAQETAVGKQMPRQPLRRMALGVIPHHDPASRVGVGVGARGCLTCAWRCKRCRRSPGCRSPRCGAAPSGSPTPRCHPPPAGPGDRTTVSAGSTNVCTHDMTMTCRPSLESLTVVAASQNAAYKAQIVARQTQPRGNGAQAVSERVVWGGVRCSPQTS